MKPFQPKRSNFFGPTLSMNIDSSDIKGISFSCLFVWQSDFACSEQLRACGEAFMAADHYAVDCIRPKCCELQRICNEFNEQLDRRRRTLEISHRLHQHVDKVLYLSFILHPCQGN